MIIDKIVMGDNELSFNSGVNIVTGHTKTNKTLLFYAVEFLFCIDSSLNINSAIKSFNCEQIKIYFKNIDDVIIIARRFSKKFYAEINGKLYDNKNNYKKELAKIFSFEEIAVENGNQTNTFYLKDYIKFMFIPEEQLSSPKNIFERVGEVEKLKIKAFFKYMITGETIKFDLLKKNASCNKSNKSISNFKTTINKLFQKPKAKDIERYNKLLNDKTSIISDIERIQLEVSNLSKEMKENQYALARLKTLLSSYEEDVKNFKYAELFERLEEIQGEEISRIDYEYYFHLNKAIEDVSQLHDWNLTILNQKMKKFESLQNVIKNNNIKLSEIETEIQSYSSIEEYNDMISLTKKITNINENVSNQVSQIIEIENRKINDSFTNNIGKLCSKIKERLAAWGLKDVETVSFNYLTYDFEFNDNPIKISPKGEKSILSFAINLEIFLLMKELKINIPNFILVDSCWVATDLKYITQSKLKEKILSNLSLVDIQIIIFENEDRRKKIKNFNYVKMN